MITVNLSVKLYFTQSIKTLVHVQLSPLDLHAFVASCWQGTLWQVVRLEGGITI